MLLSDDTHPSRIFFSNNEGWSYVLITSLNFCWSLFQLSQRAREIYNTFLSSKATTPVNIDSQAQLADDILNAPKPDMFKEQQLQVVYYVRKNYLLKPQGDKQ